MNLLLQSQAHREAFEYFIEDFKSYKPILAAIKNEYEMMLNHQNTYIKQLEPLRQMLVTVTEECDKQIMKLRDDEKNGSTFFVHLLRNNTAMGSYMQHISISNQAGES